MSSRITLATIGLTWLVIGTSTVGLMPNWRYLPIHLFGYHDNELNTQRSLL